MADTKPTVSILIPVFNRESYIGPCIQSAIDQTFADIEIIVVDNASEDGTWDVCREYAQRDPRVRIFRNAENLGPVRNWLECLGYALGRYTRILWSDDLMHPEYLRLMLPFLEKDTVGFVYSGVTLFSDAAPNVQPVRSIDDARTLPTKRFIQSALGDFNVPASPGCALFRTIDVKRNLRRDIPNRLGVDFSRVAIGNDLLLFLLTALDYEHFVVVDTTLSYFRHHDESITVATESSKSKGGDVCLHYDIARAYFAAEHLRDTSLTRTLNVSLLLDLVKYRSKTSLAIRRLDDFYPSGPAGGIDFSYLLRRIARRLGIVTRHSTSEADLFRQSFN